MTHVSVPTHQLNDGQLIPALGLGTWPLDDNGAERAVGTALELGYRLIDTAAAYRNERGVGKAIVASRVPRDEIFVTSKLDGPDHGYERAIAAGKASLERLGLDGMDLFLIHWPEPERELYLDAWRGLIRLRDDGIARSIGVSNFSPEQIQRLVDETGVVPSMNQIQLYPGRDRAEGRAWLTEHGIAVEAYTPIGRGAVLDDPAIADIATAHGRTAAQVVLRWHLQLGTIPIPKSSDPGRLAENLAVFDFELDATEMARLGSV